MLQNQIHQRLWLCRCIVRQISFNSSKIKRQTWEAWTLTSKIASRDTPLKSVKWCLQPEVEGLGATAAKIQLLKQVSYIHRSKIRKPLAPSLKVSWPVLHCSTKYQSSRVSLKVSKVKAYKRMAHMREIRLLTSGRVMLSSKYIDVVPWEHLKSESILKFPRDFCLDQGLVARGLGPAGSQLSDGREGRWFAVRDSQRRAWSWQRAGRLEFCQLGRSKCFWIWQQVNKVISPYFINYLRIYLIFSGGPKPGWVRNQLQNIFQPTDNKLAMKLFGSKKALIQERVRQKAAGHWIIHPCSSFRFSQSH